jgi:prephenate dehydrogenase
MSEDDFLGDARIAILGLGLMGGSLALALRGRCRLLLGSDPDVQTLAAARQLDMFAELSPDPAPILPQSDLIVLAAPVNAILELIPRLPAWHPGQAVVFDLGSTKAGICQAMEALPPRFDPIGGHPMCGKETSGLANAEAGLFKQAAFSLSALPRTSSRAQRLVEQLVRAVGALPLWLEPATHDRWVAASSHLPYLLSVCLALSLPEEAIPMIGPGWRTTTRLAAGGSKMMADVLSSNRENLLHAVEVFRSHLDTLEAALKADARVSLLEILDAASAARARALDDLPARSAQ